MEEPLRRLCAFSPFFEGGECDTVVQYAACPFELSSFLPSLFSEGGWGLMEGRGAQFDSDYSGGDGASYFFLFGGESVL